MASSGPLPSTAEGDSPAGDIPESREVDVPRVESMTRLREETAQFLRRLGVPAFADRSIVWKYGRIMPLIWMLSLQLGVVTASDVISGNALIVSAPIVAFVAFLAGPMSANALAIDTSRQRWLLLPLAVLPIFVFFVIRDTIAPLKLDDSQWLVPHFWCDAAVMLVALYAATIFLLPQAQASSRGGLIVLWITLLFMAATTILFSAAAPIVWTVGEVQEHTSFLPLLAMTAVLTVALALPAQSTDQRYLALSYALTVPLAAMVLTAGLINGLLIYFAGSAAATALSTAIALIVVAAAVTRYVGAKRRDRTRSCEATASKAESVGREIAEPRLRYWIPAFLLAYPTFAWLFYADGRLVVFDSEYSGIGVVIALFVFNVFYLLLVWTLVGLGLDSLTVWSAKEFWRKKVDTIGHMANAAPMLLIFVAFFALTAETWEVAYELPLRTLLGLCALLLAVAAVLVLGWSIALLRRERQFRDWADVDKQLDDFAKALYELPKDRESASIAKHLKHWVGAGACEQPVSRLSVTAWINAFLVVLVYQFFIFGAIAVMLFLLFLMLAQIAVPAPVAAEWIFGDGQQEMASKLDRVSVEAFGGLLQGDLNVLNSPWFRVPLFLTLFCSLQFAAQSLTSEESRGRYFRGIDIAIRRRFAIHLAYRLLQLNPDQQLTDRYLPTRELPSMALAPANGGVQDGSVRVAGGGPAPTGRDLQPPR